MLIWNNSDALTCRCCWIFLSESWPWQPSCGSYELAAKRSHHNLRSSKSVTNISCNIEHIHTYLWLYDIYHICICVALAMYTPPCLCLSLYTAGPDRAPISPSAITAQGDSLSPCQSISQEERGTHFWPFFSFSTFVHIHWEMNWSSGLCDRLLSLVSLHIHAVFSTGSGFGICLEFDPFERGGKEMRDLNWLNQNSTYDACPDWVRQKLFSKCCIDYIQAC